MIKLKMLLTILFSNILFLQAGGIKLIISSNNTYINSVEITENYRLDALDDGIYLTNNQNYLKLEGDNITLVELERSAYIFYESDDALYLKVYSISLKQVKLEKLFDYIPDKYYLFNNDGLVILYNYKSDIFIKELKDDGITKTFIGMLKEEALGIYEHDNNLYLVARKDRLSGGDFGNGGSDGSLVILKLDRKYNALNYYTIDILNDFYDLSFTSDFIYLIVNDNDTKRIYLFDYDFKFLMEKELKEDKLIHGNGLLLGILFNKFTIYDDLTFEKLSIETLDYDKITVYPEFIYFIKNGSGFYLDIVDLRKYENINFTSKYLSILSSVKTLMSNATLVSKNYEEYYDENIFGLYHLELEYKTDYDLSFLINTTVNIDPKCNIEDGMIYPAGFRLELNGYGILDNVNIVNNYPVMKEGKHTLTFSGVNKEDVKRYFYISPSQTDFKVSSLYEGIKVESGDNPTIYYNLDKDIKVSDIMVIGADVLSFECLNKKLKITFDKDSIFEDSSVLIHYIEYEEEYLNKIVKRKVYLNDEYIFNEELEKPIINLTDYTDNYEFKFEIIDANKTVRGLALELVNNNSTYLYYFPLDKGKILFEDIIAGNYLINVKVLVSTLNNKISEVDLLSLSAHLSSYSEIGDVYLMSKSDSISRYTLNLNENLVNDSLTKITLNNKDIYIEEKKAPLLKVVITSVVFFTCGFGITFLIIKLLKKKKQKRLGI